jgi:hypothetical protein
MKIESENGDDERQYLLEKIDRVEAGQTIQKVKLPRIGPIEKRRRAKRLKKVRLSKLFMDE